MPLIKPSSALKNNYNEISEFLDGKLGLYKLLDEGVAAKKQKRVRPFRQVLADIKKSVQID